MILPSPSQPRSASLLPGRPRRTKPGPWETSAGRPQGRSEFSGIRGRAGAGNKLPRSFQGPTRRCRGRRNRDLQELRISPPRSARALPSSSSQVHSLRQRRPLHADVQILGHDEGSRKRPAEGEGQGQGTRPSRPSGGSRTGDQSSGADGTSHRRHLQAAQDPLSLHHLRDRPQLLPTSDAPLRARHEGRSNNSLALHPLHSFRGHATEPGGAWPQVPQRIPLWRMERDLQNQAGPRGEACFGKDPRGQRGDHRRGWTGLPLPPGGLHPVPGRQHRHRGDSETGPGAGVQTVPSTDSEGDRDLQGRTAPHPNGQDDGAIRVQTTTDPPRSTGSSVRGDQENGRGGDLGTSGGFRVGSSTGDGGQEGRRGTCDDRPHPPQHRSYPRPASPPADRRNLPQPGVFEGLLQVGHHQGVLAHSAAPGQPAPHHDDYPAGLAAVPATPDGPKGCSQRLPEENSANSPGGAGRGGLHRRRHYPWEGPEGT